MIPSDPNADPRKLAALAALQAQLGGAPADPGLGAPPGPEAAMAGPPGMEGMGAPAPSPLELAAQAANPAALAQTMGALPAVQAQGQEAYAAAQKQAALEALMTVMSAQPNMAGRMATTEPGLPVGPGEVA